MIDQDGDISEEPGAEWEAEQRDRLAHDLAHPVWDPQQQPDGSYRDAEAERRSDAGLAGDFQASAAPALRRTTVSLTIDADVLDWMKAEFPDWQGQVNGLLRFFHDTAIDRAAAFDPDGFEPGEMTADPPPTLEFA